MSICFSRERLAIENDAAQPYMLRKKNMATADINVAERRKRCGAQTGTNENDS